MATSGLHRVQSPTSVLHVEGYRQPGRKTYAVRISQWELTAPAAMWSIKHNNASLAIWRRWCLTLHKGDIMLATNVLVLSTQHPTKSESVHLKSVAISQGSAACRLKWQWMVRTLHWLVLHVLMLLGLSVERMLLIRLLAIFHPWLVLFTALENWIQPCGLLYMILSFLTSLWFST